MDAKLDEIQIVSKVPTSRDIALEGIIDSMIQRKRKEVNGQPVNSKTPRIVKATITATKADKDRIKYYLKKFQYSPKERSCGENKWHIYI
tara:strand:- start:398 stop:667 length:270 start_codon:yes stop_codon:yes gene_type:complete